MAEKTTPGQIAEADRHPISGEEQESGHKDQEGKERKEAARPAWRL